MLRLAIALLAAGSALAADDSFELHVRPVLAGRCYSCHTDAKSGGLRLDSREGLLAGGKSGPAIKPGDAENSLLIQAIRQTHPKLKMPPGGKLKDNEIEAIAAWVKAGAIWPAGSGKTAPYAITAEQRSFWSFRPVTAPEPPRVRDAKWARKALDRFILAKLEEKGLSPAPPADRRTLIRRAYLDLTGLPPTPEDVEAFERDKSPDAFAKVVDTLLASPRYGERWGRYWLDIARYSDDKLNSTEDEPYPNSFRYRDWVISAFNVDMPYDQFVKAQIAGDLLADKDKYEAGLGFYALSPEMQDDRVDATTRGFLGLTVACAQCHDHKFDPIPQSDYYALLGIFNNTELSEAPLAPKEQVEAYQAAKKKADDQQKALDEYIAEQSGSLARMLAEQTAAYMMGEPDLDAEVAGKWKKYLGSPQKEHPYLKAWFAAKTPAEKKKAADEFQELLLAVDAEKRAIDDRNHITLGINPNRNDLSQANLASLERNKFVLWEDFFGKGKGVLYFGDGKLDRFLGAPWKLHLETLHSALLYYRKAIPPEYPYLQTIADKKKLGEQKVWLRGDRNNPGAPAPPHFVSVLSPGEPRKFTRGSGRADLADAIADPANPLTARVIVNRIWQHHFGQGLVRTPSNFGAQGDRPAEPELLDYLASELVRNGWSIKKLQREIMLSAEYQLSAAPNEKALTVDPDNRLLWRFNRQRLDAESLRDDLLFAAGKLDTKEGGPAQKINKEDNTRRTVYAFVSRRKTEPDLALFDFPNPNNTSEQRSATNVPPQRLFFMNNAWVIELAKAFAARLSGDDSARIDQAYRILFQRLPSPQEKKLGLDFVRGGGNEKAWQEYAQVLMTSNEFEFVE